VVAPGLKSTHLKNTDPKVIELNTPPLGTPVDPTKPGLRDFASDDREYVTGLGDQPDGGIF